MATANTQVNLKTRTGNRVIVTFGGAQVGLVQSVRMNDDYGLEPASGIGDIHVQENVPTMARHTISVQAMILNVGAMLKAGIAVENGDGALLGVVLDIESYSKDDGTLLRKYVGCSYASGDMEISKHQILMQSAQFMALDVQGANA
jgi:hypothetical protein